MRIYAFGCIGRFLGEERTEPYKGYGEGVPEPKIWLGAKNSRGATCAAGWQAGEVRKS